MKPVNLAEKLTKITDHWSPKIIGRYNENDIMVVKVKGEFIWHSHEKEDEMFLVLDGELTLEFRDRTVVLKENEFLIVPRGVEHRPVAHNEVSVMLIEPASTVNTGKIKNERTREGLDYI